MGGWRRQLACVTVCGLLLGAARPARAHETDHFTPPPHRPFADLGPLFTAAVHAKLVATVERINARLARCTGAGREAERARLQEPDELARVLAAEFGVPGFYIGDLEVLFHSPAVRRRFPGLLVAHRPVPCIYDQAIFPLDMRRFYLLWRSSTTRIGDVYISTDKLGHFIHHGYNYFAAYRAALRSGADPAAAERAAVTVGIGDHFLFSERRALGTLTSGVISNADIAANYLGFKFYRNLTEPVRVRGTLRPPLLELRDGTWRLAPHVTPTSDFVTAYFSEHFDEALNPNLYDRFTAAALRRIITRLCPQTRRLYTDCHGEPRPPEYFQRLAHELTTYYGEDYGHLAAPGELVALVTCLAPTDATAQPAARLHAAARQGDAATVAALLAAGLSPDCPDPSPDLPAAARGATPLHAAAARGDPATVQALLQAGASLHAATVRGVTALHKAVEHPAVIKLLLDAGADPHACDAVGRTPLHWAARAGHAAAARLLLDHGADPRAADRDDETPLHAAAARGHAQVAAILVQRGADIRAAARYGLTPLHLAARANHAEVVRVLLAQPAAAGARDEFGWTPLHEAAAGGNEEVALLLLAAGADVAARDAQDSTPLHLAARAGHDAVARRLLAAGADRTAVNAAGRTPPAEARLAGRPALAALLDRPETARPPEATPRPAGGAADP